jgi:redox-sensitive bicupin YhaK (pirin superfamily)
MLSPQEDGASLSPFLLLDYAAPELFPAGERPRGVGEHPHRGFETVTVVYQGELEHRDSSGSRGTIGPGDVQWMTAASGVVHEEKHSRAFAEVGGVVEMVQFWVNLPARLKMSEPGYQDLRAGDIPVVELPGGATARVIAGELSAVAGPARTATPVLVLDLHLPADATAELEIPEGYPAALLARTGRVDLGGQVPARGGELAVFGRTGDRVRLAALQETRALLLAGEPLDEPVAAHGPFVMNTREELREAVRDYQAGRMGSLPE